MPKSRSSRPRRRKGSGSANRRSVRPTAASDCDCPACTDASLDPLTLMRELVDSAAGLDDVEDLLEVELFGALVLATAATASDDPFDEAAEETLVEALVPQAESVGTANALALLLALTTVASPRAAATVSAAAGGLRDAGVQPPSWIDDLAAPVTVTDCVRFGTSDDSASMLAATFHRAGRSHTVVMTVDETDCAAASEIFLFAGALPATMPDEFASTSAGFGATVHRQALDAAEYRWYAERSLDARAVHDGEGIGGDGELDEALFTEDGPGYPVMAVLLRARLRSLPVPDQPPAAHAGPVHLTEQVISDVLARLSGVRSGARTPRSVSGSVSGRGPTARQRAPKLPAKRKKSDPPAPVYQLKVGLRGVKPPIWRRLEVPADLRLDRLHDVIQAAFGWHNSHLHSFETPFGRFGDADDELALRVGTTVTLEQVAPEPKSKLTYTYDFGDNWCHDIVVEQVRDRDPAVQYPRCTGGRRAAPPEDCGGVWGYAALLEALDDPSHPDHDDRLDWLGLDDAAGFDPDRFDPEALTKMMSQLH